MMQRLDSQKMQQWKERFKKFRSSGMTVEQFCSNEQVSANTFYYWKKRVDGRTSTVRSAQHELAFEGRGESVRRATCVVPNNALVHFRFHAAEISVPANCLDVIRCLTLCAHHAPLKSNHTFHEVRPRHSITTE